MISSPALKSMGQVAVGLFVTAAWGADMDVSIDPITRYFHLAYTVPAGVPEQVTVRCDWSPAGQEQWRPARVVPLMSETATRLLPEEPHGPWREWLGGVVTEYRAAGRRRTMVFNPYPEAQTDGKVDIVFRVRVLAGEEALARYESRLTADNSDVAVIEDWTQVAQSAAVAVAPKPVEQGWTCCQRGEGSGLSGGNELWGQSPPDQPLPDLTYPLNLHGPYALFVCTRARYGVGLRLSGDERPDGLDSRHPGQEILWRWAPLDRQNLIVNQLQGWRGYSTTQVDYVRLVPLTEAQVTALDGPYAAPRDKFVAAYLEPYSEAFSERTTDPLMHHRWLSAFAAARVDLVDSQMGRFGAKVNYESAIAERLTGTTIGDPIGKIARPTTDNVGLMQQYTNTCQTEVRYARELGLEFHANFGATNCYAGTPLEGAVSREHPDWRRGSTLRYELPEVRAFILSLYREVLDIGAPGISIDFCRYPEGIDTADTCTGFLRELRALADEVGQGRGRRVPVLVRFPGEGVRTWRNFDFATWVKEGLVDYLCPSNIQGRHVHLPLDRYLVATRGTACKLLPVVDGLGWGPPLPGPFLWRVRQIYQAGADGVYVYQADGRILGRPADRQCIALLGSSQGLDRWWADEESLRSRASKRIGITPYLQEAGYHGWERLRVWTDGIEWAPMEFHLDGKLVHRCDGPPYVLGREDTADDGIIPPGPHTLLIRAKDGDGWLEQVFDIVGG